MPYGALAHSCACVYQLAVLRTEAAWLLFDVHHISPCALRDRERAAALHRAKPCRAKAFEGLTGGAYKGESDRQRWIEDVADLKSPRVPARGLFIFRQ